MNSPIRRNYKSKTLIPVKLGKNYEILNLNTFTFPDNLNEVTVKKQYRVTQNSKTKTNEPLKKSIILAKSSRKSNFLFPILSSSNHSNMSIFFSSTFNRKSLDRNTISEISKSIQTSSHFQSRNRNNST